MAGETPANPATLASRRERLHQELAAVAQQQHRARAVVDDEAGGWTERSGPDGWPAAAGTPHRDQVCALCFRKLAHNTAGLTVKLPRLDYRSQPTRRLLRLRKCLGATFDFRFGERALTMRRQLVAAGSAGRKLEARPRPDPANE
jgi:hypothetical protein